MKLEFSRRIFEKYSNIKLHEYLLSGSRVVACGQTYRHDEATNRFLHSFCEGAQLTPWETFLSGASTL